MIRLFLALPLSDKDGSLLYERWDARRFSSPFVRWIPAHQYHVTLIFFGELDKGDLPGICTLMDEAAALYPPFTLNTGGAGQFPLRGQPRVLIERLDDTRDGALAAFRQFLYVSLQSRFSLEKKRFRPHITTARIRGQAGGGRKNPVPLDTFTAGGSTLELSLDELVLFESVLRPEGAVYNPVYCVPLTGRDAGIRKGR
ncbi:MAG: RNA 2',3'-cyclic phosphodiesterase [Spirochaetales bacterium]|nr:RNA 2',3'-cyclic phosphodiesterase [Spirochaetales bacterium]